MITYNNKKYLKNQKNKKIIINKLIKKKQLQTKNRIRGNNVMKIKLKNLIKTINQKNKNTTKVMVNGKNDSKKKLK